MRETVRRAQEECARNAKRLGMSRREFGRRLVRKQFGRELERLSAGRADVARSIA